MTKKVAVFGKMGVKFAPIIEENFADKYEDWQVTSWPCDDDIAARDAVLAECEAAVMSADFILTPGNFGALMAAPNLKILLQPWVGIDWLDDGFLPKGLRFAMPVVTPRPWLNMCWAPCWNTRWTCGKFIRI